MSSGWVTGSFERGGQVTADVELVWDAGLRLGEAPIWDQETATLIMVDIVGGSVHRVDPRQGEVATMRLGDVASAVIPRSRGGLVVLTRDSLISLGPLGVVAELCRFPLESPRQRMNDAKCDPAGRLFAGSIDPGGSPTACLFRVDRDLSPVAVVHGVTVSNGLAWSGDATTFFYTDSPTGNIDRFDYDPGSGHLANRTTVATVEEGAGVPDGMCIDDEDHLWVALFGGAAVRRYSPNGDLVDEVGIPAPSVTSCCFGGDDFSDLYVTTSTLGDSAAFPLAGGVFRFRPAIGGRAPVRFAG